MSPSQPNFKTKIKNPSKLIEKQEVESEKKGTLSRCFAQGQSSSCVSCHSASHPEVCLFLGPRPAGVLEVGGDKEQLSFLFRCPIKLHPLTRDSTLLPTRCPPSSSPSRIIQKLWRARLHRRCRCSTWWDGTPRRGSTPQTSYGEQ